MDLWSVHVKNTNLLLRNSKHFVFGHLKCENLKVLEVRLPKRHRFSGSLLVNAMGKKNSDNSNSGKGPEEDSLKGSNPSSENDGSKNTGAQKFHQKPLDWREFRASLYIQELEANEVSDTHKQEGTNFGPKVLPLKWAHPISAPEKGCVLVATEKLDGVCSFERTVVLLLRSGTRHPQEGPFGVVINRPLGKQIKHMKPTNLDLATTFADCSLHFGGPLEASIFLLRSGAGSELPRFEEVIPGVCFGARNSLEEASACVRLLCNTGGEVRKIWLSSCRESFVNMLSDKQLRESEEIKAKAQISHAQPDDLIDFYHLKSRRGMSQLELEDEVQDDLKRATGEFVKDENDANKLSRVLQLTGFSDPVYAEAYVTVHHYDIVLDVTIINRTKETLQNLCLELATMGDLKLVERPQNYTLAPQSSKQIKANIKVSSTETGVIFGNIVYEASNVLDRTVIVLNDIHIDIMDYISPAVCSEAAFRTMWAEFEWENKVAVNTVIQAEKEFLDHIIKSTNMKCLTAPSALESECGFLAANLYAKSAFGEDALVNLSVEKQSDGKLSGYIRIRSKTQGIALSLGDKITLKQKGGN